MNNTDNNKNIDKNKLYIGIFTLVIIIAVIILLISRCGKDDDTPDTSNNSSNGTVAALLVDSETGDQEETIKKKINIPSRKIDFTKSMKDIMKFEEKQEDTLPLEDNYKPAQSSDGYTYVMYKFNNVNAPKFFGTQIATSDENAMLTYVFYKEKLTEVRIQYGNVGTNGYNDIIKNITSLYGDPTYSRSYSNGSLESWWKNKSVTLDIICQDAKVIAYYRKNN